MYYFKHFSVAVVRHSLDQAAEEVVVVTVEVFQDFNLTLAKLICSFLVHKPFFYYYYYYIFFM